MLNRLIIQFPLLLLVFTLMLSIVVPIVYWILTGDDPMDAFEEIIDKILDIELW